MLHAHTIYKTPPWGVGGLLLFLLSFALMFIMGSCKSSRSVEAKTDSVSVQSVRMEDSLHLDRTFQFDRLDVYYYDVAQADSAVAPSYPPKLVKAVCITKGSASSAITKTERQTQADSTAVKHQDVIHPVITPPKLPSWLILALLVFIIMISRNRT